MRADARVWTGGLLSRTACSTDPELEILCAGQVTTCMYSKARATTCTYHHQNQEEALRELTPTLPRNSLFNYTPSILSQTAIDSFLADALIR